MALCTMLFISDMMADILSAFQSNLERNSLYNYNMNEN